ncbi:hypothetical protein B0T16DRAFT_457615 [Cercophora newfieldiana]|uniref:Uncharacterized protein n=1 Tax=Cercophora newfieldiana TaxID=92897 RepID=A0AA39Y3Z0_9PEZI|nr:hypothetical protein B0T16DRAFT_457615 [Cercophora newfieldiana]
MSSKNLPSPGLPSPGSAPARPVRPVRQSYNSNYSDKPLPTPSPERPGTSGTEAELEAQLRRMAEELENAKRQKRLYRARKATATQRANRHEAKAHFGKSFRHFGLGVKLSWAVFTGIPVYLREKHKLRGEEDNGDDMVLDRTQSVVERSRSILLDRGHSKKGKAMLKDEAPRESRDEGAPVGGPKELKARV